MNLDNEHFIVEEYVLLFWLYFESKNIDGISGNSIHSFKKKSSAVNCRYFVSADKNYL
jgi:hypothetical protein